MQCLVAFVNYFTKPLLFNTSKSNNNLVSILIPARNEEKNISKILDSLINEDYKDIEIIILNDNSTDRTEDILKEYSSKYEFIKYINGEELKKGWLGKNWACFQLSKIAKGDYYLFLDADTIIEKGLINSSLSYLKTNEIKLLSLFPSQIMITLGEKLTVPLMNNILLSLLPLISINNTKYTSLSAANGQFMLFDANNYNENKWHEKVKSEITEDIKIIRLMKKNNIRVMTLLGNNLIKCRMYSNISEAINGFSKNIILMLGGSLTFLFIYLFFNTWVWIYLILNFKLWKLTTIILLLLSQRVLISLSSNQNVINNIILYPFQMVLLNIISFNAIYKKYNKNLTWKDRVI
jgi:glycosyltransferase involved in cell wall biosynthesis